MVRVVEGLAGYQRSFQTPKETHIPQLVDSLKRPKAGAHTFGIVKGLSNTLG